MAGVGDFEDLFLVDRFDQVMGDLFAVKAILFGVAVKEAVKKGDFCGGKSAHRVIVGGGFEQIVEAENVEVAVTDRFNNPAETGVNGF